MNLPIVPFNEIRDLPLADLALHLLTRLDGHREIHANNTLRGLQQAIHESGEPDGDVLMSRVASAWAWLEARAYVGPHPYNTQGGWQQVTETGAEAAKDPAALTKTWAAERLAGRLDPLLSSARANFGLGDYETACFAAMKAVEIEVRRVAELPNELVGVSLMRKAFSPVDGPLSDFGAEGGERQATADLFAGAMGVFKNPTSHRAVQFDDSIEAAEAIQLADLLLRIVHRAASRRQQVLLPNSERAHGAAGAM